MIKWVNFELDKSVVAPVIYGTCRHETTGRGVELSSEIATELRRFLAGFNASLGVIYPPYYRIDAYFDQWSVNILELNASFVDGWGTALNLARAAGIQVPGGKLLFPEKFATLDEVYKPELELFVRELGYLGHRHVVSDVASNADSPVYVYGRIGTKENPNTLPHDGLRLDNKFNLAEFSHEWKGEIVRIPRHYTNRSTEWRSVPSEVVLKFADKNGPECRAARQSVIIGKPAGKAAFIRKCYECGSIVAQDLVHPAQRDGENCQLVIMAIGDEPITGYVQYSHKKIINDNSVHGPLVLSV